MPPVLWQTLRLALEDTEVERVRLVWRCPRKGAGYGVEEEIALTNLGIVSILQSSKYVFEEPALELYDWI